jgi:hypothetical protein
MTKSRGQRKGNSRRFETAGALVIGRAQVRRTSSSSLVRWRRLRIILALSLVVAAVGALWLALDGRFYIYYADVRGVERLSADEVFQASGLPGLHVLWARSTEVEARLLRALPSVESARVTCSLPARCAITIVERQPRVAWEEEGRWWWIDVEGVVFPVASSFSPFEGDQGAAGGWTVQGPLPRDEDGRLDERVRIALAELWTAAVDVPAPLTYMPTRGLVFVDERGWKVILGQGPGMDRRMQVLDGLVAELEARGLTPRFVDVRFADAPYYSLINDW